MATATSRMSLDPPPSLRNLAPLVTHALPNPHPRVPDLAPAAHSQTRRVSSESQGPGRASPSPRVSRRTPVPFLLEAFPAPPSHIPGTPTSVSPSNLLTSPSLLVSTVNWLSSASASSAVCTSPVSPSSSNAISPCSPKSVVATLLPHNNPPPSSPPTGPLPPIPGPSSVARDLFTTHRAFQAAAGTASPAPSVSESQRSQSRSESRPRLSLDSNEPVRARRRQGSLSSLRNPVHPMGEQSATIAEEPVEEPRPRPPPPPPSAAPQSLPERKSHDQSRGGSVEILRPCLSRVVATPLVRPDDKPYAGDSIASIDMSELNAIKSDNEGEGDEQASCPFPRFPPLPHSQAENPTDPPQSAPAYVHAPRKQSKSSVCSIHVSSTSEDVITRDRAMSPEITQIISATPRPRKRSTPSRSRDSSSTRNRKDSSKSARGGEVPPVPTSSRRVKTSLVTTAARLSGDDEVGREDEGHESDSSLDLHTPLPQLMLRHGMLSPNSKLLPPPEVDPTRLSIMSGISSSSYVSNASNVSLMSMTSSCSKHPKDARDTPQRRVRHRDGKLLKGGIGLTTGLGWSDSEDEDAPSPLTRRLSTLVLSRRPSSSSIASQSQSQSNSAHPLSRSISHNILREVDEYETEDNPDEFGYSNRSSLGTRSLPSRSKPVSRVGSARSIASSRGRYSTYSASSVGPTAHRTRAGSVSESSIYAASIASKPDSFASNDGTAGLMPGIREHDDGVTPTRAAFERSSVGSSGADTPHTPSSTASSGSLPFPPTPESGEEISHLQHVYDQDKVLPPLPPSVKGKYPSTLGLRSQSAGLQRPRTFSNASSVSNSSIPGVPPSDTKSRSTSTTSTPRQSLAERHTKTPRPSINGTPRPSLTIPKSPLPPQSPISGLPRPTTPSLATNANAGQGYTPRPLRLAELNQSPTKVVQPGEQSPRPGQVLTYNRNVHDQLKLRTISMNTGPNRPQAPAVSPGGTQTLFMSSSGAPSAPSSAVSTPVTAQSQSPLPSSSPTGEGFRPRPRTGTGMVYRTNLSVGTVAASRMRIPSTVPR